MKKKNPYKHDDFDKASEYLRLAIQWLSKHKIPPSPVNFRLVYDYVAGKSEELKAAFDQVMTRSRAVSSESLWEIYRRLFIEDERALEKVREELGQLIANVQSEVERSGGDLSSYGKTLNRFTDILNTSPTPESMRTEVKKVIDDTRSMEDAQQRLESSMNNAMTEVESLRKELEQVRKESLTDALTGIPNRKAFDTALEQAIQSAYDQQQPFCLLLADIDHFKQFNDTYGHLVGDKVLRFVASTLKCCLKDKDMAARYGGEEFAVILPQTALKGAEAISEEMRQAISAGELKDAKTGRGYGRVTASIGISQFRWNESPDELVERTDQALYQAKERGRNRVEKAA